MLPFAMPEWVTRLWMLSAGIFAVATGVIGPDRAEAAPPNVIIVMTDDQGYGDLSCHGNPILKTPHLDRLHARSVRLTDFHVAPMCTPTRGQLLTGVHCLRNGAMNVSSGRTLLRTDVPTAAELFAHGGYRTGLFGKWHLGDNYPFRPHDRGFEEAVWFPSSHISSAPDFFTNDYFDDTYFHLGVREAYDGYCTDVFFREAMLWMQARAAQNSPFFCYLATNAPHGPLLVPAGHRALYERHDLNEKVARFFGMLANIDDNMGRLLEFLDRSGLADNTILIFLTDNGGTGGVPIYNAGMRGGKIELYDGGHRVPCFVRWPHGHLREPGDVAALTQVQDLLPTLIELCGLPAAEAERDGISLAPLLRGGTDEVPDRTLFIQFSRINAPVPQKGDACVLWRRWRLVKDSELYDLAADPAQETNVIEAHPEIAAQLRQAYDQWWAEVSPRMNEHPAIIVGSPEENPLTLSPPDWIDVFLDQGLQVRAGVRRNGAWKIDVASAGNYEITLRRWPEEADTPIPDAIPSTPHADGMFRAGQALPVAAARLQVGRYDETQPVAATDKCVRYRLELPAGITELKTWFLDAGGDEIAGAYYVTVHKE